MNFNGQLLPAFFCSSLRRPLGHPSPPQGISRLTASPWYPPSSPSPDKTFLRLPPSRTSQARNVAPKGTTITGGAAITTALRLRPEALGTFGGFPRDWMDVKAPGDATSEPSIFISSCLTPPRGTITKGSNLITSTQPSVGENGSPGHPPMAVPTARAAASRGPPDPLKRCHDAPPGVFWSSDDVSPGPCDSIPPLLEVLPLMLPPGCPGFYPCPCFSCPCNNVPPCLQQCPYCL